MRRVFLLLFCLATMPALAQGPGGQRPGAPAPQPPTGPTQDRAVNVINRANVAITTLYVSSTEEDNWGSNRLTGQPLAAGRSLQVRLGQGRHCRFDVQVAYSDGKVEEKRDQDICRNRQVVFDASTAALPVDRTERKVTILNRAPRTIKQVFLSPKTASNWGDDALGGTIAAGEDTEVTFHGDCVVDIRIVFDNSSAEERREADLCTHATVVIAPGWTTTDEIPATEADIPRATPAAAATGAEITAVNITGKPVEELYVFPEGATNEGPDRLGSDTLDDGGNFHFRLDRRGACAFNIHAVLADNAGDVRLRGVDLCASAELRLDGSGVSSQQPPAAHPATPAPAPPAGPPPAGVTRLRNGGATQAVAIFADPAGSPRGVDRLGDRLVGPGESFDLALPVAGQCSYHLVVIYRDGRNAERDADLCASRDMPLP